MTISAGTDGGRRAAGLTGAIMAGGESRRMGRDKAGLRLAGKPLARRVAEILAPVVDELWLVTNHPEAHLALGLPLITDLIPFQGPVGGLATALFYARTPWVLLASADAPLLSGELARALAAAAGKISRPALVCRSERGLLPFPGLYATRLLPRIEDFLKEQRCFRALLDRVRPEVWEPAVWNRFDAKGASFENLNQPEDLVRLTARAAAGDIP